VVVCVLTGHGLKDPGTAMESVAAPVGVPADVEAVAEVLGL
jgi:threonine synthase